MRVNRLTFCMFTAELCNVWCEVRLTMCVNQRGGARQKQALPPPHESAETDSEAAEELMSSILARR